MSTPNDQEPSGLRVSGYRSRVRSSLTIIVILAVVVGGIILATIWANSRDPEVGVQPTPRATATLEPSPTIRPTDTATPEPEEVQVPPTNTPEAVPTATPTAASEPTEEAAETPAPVEATPEEVMAEATHSPIPMPEAETPTPEPTATTSPAPTEVPTPTATSTPRPEPTSTPQPTPTPLPTEPPTPTATPTPEIPSELEIRARGVLIEQGINQEGIGILSVEEQSWLDLRLGCGTGIEGDNPAVPVNGWILVLGNDDTRYTLHVASIENVATGVFAQDLVFDCTDVEEQHSAINLVRELQLHEARRIVLYRGSAGAEQPVEDIQDPDQIQTILDAINTNIPTGNNETCQTAFRLDFYVLGGIQSVHFFCRDDWYRASGDQDIWGGTQGSIPPALLEAVSPYFSNQPIPQLPTFTPDE